MKETEKQVWEVVSRERGEMIWSDKGIYMEQWDRYFRDLMEGVNSNGKVVKGDRRGRRVDEEEEMSREELRVVLRRLKDRKAAGVDGILSKMWKDGGEGLEGWILEMSNRVWRGEGWLEEWNEG